MATDTNYRLKTNDQSHQNKRVTKEANPYIDEENIIKLNIFVICLKVVCYFHIASIISRPSVNSSINCVYLR